MKLYHVFLMNDVVRGERAGEKIGGGKTEKRIYIVSGTVCVTHECVESIKSFDSV